MEKWNSGSSRSSRDKLRPGPGLPRGDVVAHQRARIHRAVVEIVARRGYESLRIVEILRLAGVSSHTFYELFDDKDECFLDAYESVIRRVIDAGERAGERDHRAGLELALGALGRAIADDPDTAYFALVEVFAGGPAALVRMREASDAFEAALINSFNSSHEKKLVPPLVAKGIVFGLARVARARLLVGQPEALPGIAGQLAAWAECLTCPEAAALERIEPARMPLLPSALPPSEIGSTSRGDNRARMLASVLSIVGQLGYDQVTTPRLRAAVRVSRRGFAAHFQDADECFAAALVEMTERALERCTRAAATTGDWPLGIYRALIELCNMISGDPIFARLAFVEVLAPGADGIRLCEEILTGVTNQFHASAPAELRFDSLLAEASTGAVWGIVYGHVATGRAELLPQCAPTLAFLALAPSIGAKRVLAMMATGAG